MCTRGGSTYSEGKYFASTIASIFVLQKIDRFRGDAKWNNRDILMRFIILATYDRIMVLSETNR